MMTLTRRKFVTTVSAIPAASTDGMTRRPVPVKAVAFDAFPILDSRPVSALAAKVFPDRGAELANLWRTRQFEYAWLRTLSNQYLDFWRVTEDALLFAAKALDLQLDAATRARLMETWLQLKCWPDVPAALQALKQNGIRLAFLSNMTAPMLEAGIRNSGLENLFDHILSTDRVQAYKPHPRAYRMAMDAFHLDRPQIAFAAFAGWDAAGARAFGYRTFWVNRLNQPWEELGPQPRATGTSLHDLVAYLTD
jgi:2-haloacid dehalogenase